MFASVLIIAVSSVLLVYWFRYSCLLLLRNGAEEATPLSLVIQGTLSLAEIQGRLQSGAQLDPLLSLVQRDYQVLTYLVRHVSGLKLESIEERLLVWDYRTMRLWYWITKTAAPEQAREAIREMASVLNILASRIGERAGFQSEA